MYQRQVSFEDAVRSALQQNYCNFSGRASRSEFWWYILFTFLVSVVIGWIGFVSRDLGNVINTLVGLALLLPGLGLSVRRLHDTGRSGWWILINLIPVVGNIIYLVWMCQDSQMTPNQYGSVPHLQG